MSFLGLFDYPRVIRQLRDQMPTSDRDAFINQYKKLPGKEKDAFKDALRKADGASASAILGQDLTKFKIEADKSADKVNGERQYAVPGSVQAWKVAGPGAGFGSVPIVSKDAVDKTTATGQSAVAGTEPTLKIANPAGGSSAPPSSVDNVTASSTGVDPNLASATAQLYVKSKSLPSEETDKNQTNYWA